MPKLHDKWVGLLRNTISASLSLGFSLVVAEYTYAYFEPPQQKDRADISLHPFVEFNPDLGWQGKPNSSGRFNVLGVSTQVSLNAQGMRYHDIGPRKAYRVAIQGDSIVWGYGVTQQDRFTEQTETILPDVEVLNYGEVGYGPVQYLLQLDKIIEQKPDLVVVGFTLYNDFDDNVTSVNNEFYRPYGAVRDGKLLILGKPAPDYRLYTTLYRPDFVAKYALGRLFYYTLYDQFRPVYDIFFATDKTPPEWHGRGDYRPGSLYTEPDSWASLKVRQTNELVLAAMRDKLAKEHIAMMIFAIQTNQDRNANTMNLLKQQAEVLHIPFATSEGFEKGPRYTRGDQVHWNPEGHKLAATALAAAITRQRALPKP